MSATVEGLEIGKKYTFEVVAVRGTDVSEAGTLEATVVDEAQRTWAFTAYGSSTSASGNGYEGNINEGSVTVYSEGGKGKIVPASTDGLAFYYTAIDPETENFTLTADIAVDSWKLSNGQEGFGMMVADAVGPNGDATSFWNNSYQNIATKIEYYYDGENVTNDSTQSKISMKLGLGTLAKTGVTTADVEAIKTGAATMPANFSTASSTLETSCGNNGVGFFASRNARITVTNAELTTIHPDQDAPAEEKEKTYVTPSYSVASATVAYRNNAKAGTASVVLRGINNYSGTITKNFTITALNFNKLPENVVIGGTDSTIVVDYVKGGAKPEVVLTVKNADNASVVLTNSRKNL